MPERARQPARPWLWAPAGRAPPAPAARLLANLDPTRRGSPRTAPRTQAHRRRSKAAAKTNRAKRTDMLRESCDDKREPIP
eukprot:4024153-Pleurochrysis_carterae.AAC.3